MSYGIQDSDAGYDVVSPRGEIIASYPRRGAAMEHCARLNGQLVNGRQHVDRFHAAQAREFIARTKGNR